MPFVTRRFAVGELIAQKYLLLHLLGRGASGEVFRVRNTLAGNILALKLLMEEAGRDSELVQRFFREARAINRIGHPNIVAVFDAGYADTIPYLAMEYLAGESLAQLLERKRTLSVPCTVAILLGVLDALAAAHTADVVHRDLKPANIYLQTTASGVPTVKLLDFGVAKIHEEGDTSIRTESGMILGTPDYLSPEQITADTEVDGRSDLGRLLRRLMSDAPPWLYVTRERGLGYCVNIDYGFGAESAKSMIFYDGVGHHLDEAAYVFDRADPMKSWVFTDNEARVELALTPVCVERGSTNYLVLRTSLLKAYGFFTGRVRLDDGRWIEVKESDRLFGSAEAAVNDW